MYYTENMKAEIYYFSSTGNTLLLARDGAERLGGRLIPIPSFKSHSFVNSSADIVGFYFPVYYASYNEQGMPYFVRDFIKSFHGLKKKYVFAVCTHSGSPGFTLKNLDNLLKSQGARLSAGLNVKMGTPYPLGSRLGYRFLQTPLVFSEQQENARRWELLRRYRERVAAKHFFEKIGRLEKCRLPYESPAAALAREGVLKLRRKAALKRYRLLSHFGGDDFKEMTRFSDRSFTVSGDCTGCGLCAQICPVGNIEMKGGRPEWRHQCENCFACFQWCPVKAIGGENVAFEKRYHQPSVDLKDILLDDSV